jgi:hypothetical protein
MTTPRNAIVGSLWIFDPTTEEEAQVEAMPCGVTATNNGDGHVLIAARGKPGRRYETGDSVWLEMTPDQALRLIGQLAGAMT